ncbi:MAG: UvrB/UvrC motif-containing protein, partial [Lachnospiraceae bacterium]|nr:UvrB/UvrC motif-containing protein [Lachnospiraceae bacterium]
KMERAAGDLNFEIAAEYRDKLIEIKNMIRDMQVEEDGKESRKQGKKVHKNKRRK